MDLDRHDFQLDELVERIKANDNRLVALQVPEGLKMQALEMMDSIEDGSSAKVILAADPCYGACDLVHDKMRSMGVELVAHMGHSQMNIDSGMPTHFIPVTYDGDPELAPAIPFLERHRAIAQSRLDSSDEEEELDEVAAKQRFLDAVGRVAPLTGTKLGLVGSIQHLHLLPDFKERLEKAGFEVEIPVGGDRLTFPGQVLGCNYSGDASSIGHYLFLGSGDFHPIGLVLHTGKPLAMLDPYTGDATEMSFERIERILRQRFGLIMAVGECAARHLRPHRRDGRLVQDRFNRQCRGHGTASPSYCRRRHGQAHRCDSQALVWNGGRSEGGCLNWLLSVYDLHQRHQAG